MRAQIIMFNIVLLEPEKPDNTGNIGRTCVATGSALHLIYPIGFRLTRKNIHHAGLDYWDRLKLFTHDSYKDFLEILADDEEHCIRIPMIENERSLNLSNSVAVVLYEALRQNNFDNLITKGELHKLRYNN